MERDEWLPAIGFALPRLDELTTSRASAALVSFGSFAGGFSRLRAASLRREDAGLCGTENLRREPSAEPAQPRPHP